MIGYGRLLNSFNAPKLNESSKECLFEIITLLSETDKKEISADDIVEQIAGLKYSRIQIASVLQFLGDFKWENNWQNSLFYDIIKKKER